MSRDPEGLVSARVVRGYSLRMAWNKGGCSCTDPPLLQHAWRAHRTRCMIFKGSSFVIPKRLGEVLGMKIHSSHLEIGTCQERACECIYWPGTSVEMKQYIRVCEMCREDKRMTHAKETHWCPTRYCLVRGGKIGTHIFTLDGKDYMVTIYHHKYGTIFNYT